MSRIPLLFGRFLVKSGWASVAEVQRATQLQRELIPCPGLTAVMMGMLSLDELRQTFSHQRHTGQLFQEAVHELGFLDDAQLASLNAQRRAAQLPLGEAMVRQGSLTAEDLQDALQAFAHYKKTGELPPLQDMFMLYEREDTP